jgi:hypothetical protein
MFKLPAFQSKSGVDSKETLLAKVLSVFYLRERWSQSSSRFAS